jgi:multidrug transporter EmrE-like cation transporter
MSPYILLAINICLGVAGQFLIKFGVNKLPSMDSVGLQKFLISAGFSPFVISGIALYAFSSILWVILLSKLDLSVAYPALSIGYVLVLLVSMLFLGEQVSALRFAGVFLIMAGIFIIFRS